MKQALITGGLGFIGSFITRKLLEDKVVERVICLDHFGRYVESVFKDFTDQRKHRLQGISEKVVIERGDAKYQNIVFRLLKKYRPQYIFHLAALPLAKLDNLNTQEALEGSVQSTSYLLETIGLLNETTDYMPLRFVYTSSSMVYGDFKTATVKEESPIHPKEVYGTMKLSGEIITKGLAKFYRIPYTIIRPSAVYGPTDMNRRVSQIFIEKAMHNELIKVHGEQERLDFTYVKDTARGFVLAATSENGISQTFNITYGRAQKLLSFVKILQRHFPQLKYKVIERDSFRPQRGTLSISKARRLLAYEPAYNLERGIAEYLSFLKTKDYGLLKF
jgi:nucleoside-diphosphate-sugar epimerase